MTEPGNPNVENKDSGLPASKEWQAAIDIIPQIISSSRRLIELASKNKGILEEKKWNIVPIESYQSYKRKEFSTMNSEAVKGPNGETLKVVFGYPDEASNNPDFLQVYGNNQDGIFGFEFYDRSKEQKPKELEIKYNKDQWIIRIPCHQAKNVQPKDLFLDYNTEFDYDRLLVDFEGVELEFDEQGNIDLPKDKGNINLMLHYSTSSRLREGVGPRDREKVMGFLRDADGMRKRDLGEDPEFKQELIKRIGFLPPENYAQVQQERIDSLPRQVNWLEGLDIVNSRIQKMIAVFESTFKPNST